MVRRRGATHSFPAGDHILQVFQQGQGLDWIFLEYCQPDWEYSRKIMMGIFLWSE
jgi:hypothetical protein